MKKILVLCLLALVTAAPVHAQTKLFQTTPMIKAAVENNFEGMRSMLLKGSSANSTDGNGKTALMYAAVEDPGHDRLVRALVRAGARLDAKSSAGLTAADYAAKYGHAHLLEALRATAR